MSGKPPPLPPPQPPPLPFNNYASGPPQITIHSVNVQNNECNMFMSKIEGFVKKAITNSITPIAQTGPNCGMAALAMVTTLIPKSLSIEDIFIEAKSRGFTRNGEMFSAANMKVIAEAILTPFFRVELFSGTLAAHQILIVNSLYQGNLILIPYDADKNHSPCQVNGHKAHWALVCGVLETNDNQVYVAARHGKSRHMSVWSLESLCNSNANLTELGPKRATDQLEYLLPSGGVRAGLAGQFILLTRCQQNS